MKYSYVLWDEPENYAAEENQLQRTTHTLYDTYMTPFICNVQNKQTYIEKEINQWLPMAGRQEDRDGEWMLTGMDFFRESDKNVLKLIMVMTVQLSQRY